MDRTNDFAFKIATPNGTGSASANGLLMQAIFRMGVPVTGKNVFPSNIQGLPTWYEIRVSHQGYTARTPTFDLMVALNPATYQKDVAEVRSGGWLLYDSTWPLDQRLDAAGRHLPGHPAERAVQHAVSGRARADPDEEHRLRRGAGRRCSTSTPTCSRALLKEKYSRKPALIDSNQAALDLGRDYAKTHFACPLPIRLAPMDATKDAILIDGNTAAALGCLYAGATVGAWYPITPATSLMEAFKGFCQKYRREPETEPQPLRDPPGGGRDCRDRHGDWRVLGWRARVHPDLGARHLADERVPRPGLLRRGAGGRSSTCSGPVRRPACRPAPSRAT